MAWTEIAENLIRITTPSSVSATCEEWNYGVYFVLHEKNTL